MHTMVLGSTDGWGVLQGFCENEQKTAGVVMDSWLPWQLGALDASFPPQRSACNSSPPRSLILELAI